MNILKATLSIVAFSLCSPIIAENIPASQAESMDIITSGMAISPTTRHDAVIEFKQSLNRDQIVEWTNRRVIDVLSLEGTFKVGDQEVTVLLGDLGSYGDPLGDVIDTQVETYHEDAIENIIVDLSKSLVGLTDQKKTTLLRREIADLRTAKKAKIQWHQARVIASYSELYNLSVSEDAVKNVRVHKRNNADMIDEFWLQPDRQKRSINDIKPFSERNLPGSLNAFPNNESSLSSIFNVKSARSLSLRLAEQALKALIPQAHAAGALCGNKPGEAYCPPDNNFVPDNPDWYVYIAQPYVEYPDFLEGVAYTLVDWSVQGVRAFTDSASPHCQPVLTGTSANCRTLVGTLQEDVIYVPDSTYEAETEIPNPSCPFYTGTRTIDFWNGCFSAYYAISNFPSAYVDTTASDPGGKYQATIGTYAGASLNASSSYYNYVYFDARGETLALLAFQTTRTRGQVGSRIPAGCYSPFCVFGVDTSGTIDNALLVPLP